jgi:hypothetical protein
VCSGFAWQGARSVVGNAGSLSSERLRSCVELGAEVGVGDVGECSRPFAHSEPGEFRGSVLGDDHAGVMAWGGDDGTCWEPREDAPRTLA